MLWYNTLHWPRLQTLSSYKSTFQGASNLLLMLSAFTIYATQKIQQKIHSTRDPRLLNICIIDITEMELLYCFETTIEFQGSDTNQLFQRWLAIVEEFIAYATKTTGVAIKQLWKV